jgi:putative ABC transport system permease protein
MKRSLRSWLWRVPLDQEVDEELALHVELRTRELVERGLDPKTARDIVLSRIGDLGHLKRTCVDLGRKRDREMRLTQWIEERAGDVKFALRQLRAAPAFTAVAAITLALGIGANSAMFALADATLLRPLPFPRADRLVMVWERNTEDRNPRALRSAVSPINLRDWSEQNRSFQVIAATALGIGGGPLLAAPDGTVQSVDRQTVSSRFFDVLGVTPILGRTFLPSDAAGAVPTVVVMGEGVWRTRFGADPSVVGREVRLNGQPFTVIGVVPDHAQLARAAGIWSLMGEQFPPNFSRGVRFLQGIGRLKPGVSIDAAHADLSVIADSLGQAHPDTNKGWSVTVEPLHSAIMDREVQLTSMFLLGVVGFVLLMCCANVANLLLARGSVRGRELAVRSALGAGGSRIVAQLLTESVALALLGGVLGIAIGAAILEVAPTLVPAGLLPVAARISFDGRVLLFCVAASLIVGILFGLVPAWQATRTSLVQALSSESRSATRGGGRLRSVLVAGEVAAAVLLLCGAGLLLRTLLVLGNADTGYRADGDTVMTLDFSLPPTRQGTRYPNAQSYMSFYDSVSSAIRALPGVRRIGWASGLPYGDTELGYWRFEIIGDPPIPPANRPLSDFQVADAGYFETLDLPIVAGRTFTDGDTSTSALVCIVNEEFARRHFAGRNPIGMRVAIEPFLTNANASSPKVREIVGIVRQLRGRAGEPRDPVQLYVPLTQHPVSDTLLVVQASDLPASALVAPIRAATQKIDSNVPVRRERTLTDLATLTRAPHRFRALMVGLFASLALMLAMVGIFGVLAYAVEQRTREFGVRMALGASTTNVLRLVLGSAARVIVAGGAIGLAAAAALSRTISTFLFGVEPLDPTTYASVGLVLVLTAAIAAAAPAWRATRVDPVEAFRTE